MMAAFLEQQDPSIKQRRKEIEERLAEAGLHQRPRLLFPDEITPTDSGDRLEKLIQVLQDLGPVFSLFGRYLGTRADLLSITQCRALNSIEDRADPVPTEMIGSLLEQAWGKPPESVFLSFEDSLRSSRLIVQTHYGRFVDGTPVQVQVVRPEFKALVERDSQLLQLLHPAFLMVGWRDFPTESVAADFLRFLPLTMDRAADIAAMQSISEDAEKFEEMAASTILPDLSTTLVRTVERLPGWTLEEMMPDAYEDHDYPVNLDLGPTDVAGLTCLVWLRQALFGTQYPVEIDPEDISLLPTHKIVFHNGLFTSLPSIAQDHIWHYLQATAAQDPDTAFEFLMEEMEDRHAVVNEAELRVRFRQVVPFRDGAWSISESGDSLAEHLFVHWRLFREYGLQPRIHLLDFYRGLFSIITITRRLAPEYDALRVGLDQLSLKMGMDQMRDMMDMSVWQDTFGKYAASAFELPKRLDDVLERTAEGRYRSGHKSSEGGGGGHRTGSAKITGLLCLMAAIVLVYNHVTGSTGMEESGEQIIAVLLLVLGISVLRVIKNS